MHAIPLPPLPAGAVFGLPPHPAAPPNAHDLVESENLVRATKKLKGKWDAFMLNNAVASGGVLVTAAEEAAIIEYAHKTRTEFSMDRRFSLLLLQQEPLAGLVPLLQQLLMQLLMQLLALLWQQLFCQFKTN